MLAKGGAARDAVIYLEGSVKGEPLPRAMMDQRDKMFLPHVLAVTRGTTVNFPNNDSVLHNVFAYYNAKRFDLGVYPHGATKRETFDKTGVVALLCNVHSDMSAYIIVVDTPYFAVTDHDGRFHIPDVAPGSYTLRGWHESGSEIRQSLAVTRDQPGLNIVLTRN